MQLKVCMCIFVYACVCELNIYFVYFFFFCCCCSLYFVLNEVSDAIQYYNNYTKIFYGTLNTFCLITHTHTVKDPRYNPKDTSIPSRNGLLYLRYPQNGARCRFLVRAFAHGAMGSRIDPSWWTH